MLYIIKHFQSTLLRSIKYYNFIKKRLGNTAQTDGFNDRQDIRLYLHDSTTAQGLKLFRSFAETVQGKKGDRSSVV